MNETPKSPRHSIRAWLVMIAVTLFLFFCTGTTFPSVGIPLFAMAGEFHWSQTASGAAFLALGLVCAATALTPMALIPRVGGRWTAVLASLALVVGFGLAAVTRSLLVFYIAAGLLGTSISLGSNSLGTYMIANWFGERSSRVLGLYMMVGSLGAAVIPPVAGAITASAGGWRLYWVIMAIAAAAIAVFCAVVIREPPGVEKRLTGSHAKPAVSWGYRSFLATPQFLVLAPAMVGTQLCMVTVSAVTVPHFANLGWSEEYAAQIMGLQGLVGSLATGAFGWLLERYDAKIILAGALLMEAAGTLLLAFAHSAWATYAFVPVFGIGWGVSTLADTVLLIKCFGSRSGTAALSTIWMLAGVATAGPSVAGLMADMTGSFSVAISLCGLVLVPVAVATMFMDASEKAVPAALVAQE